MKDDTSTMSHFAQKIMENRYSHDIPTTGYEKHTFEKDNPGETAPTTRKERWNEIAERVVENVLGVVPRYVEGSVDPEHQAMRTGLITAVREKKFMPGGRYLFATGHDYHQTQNCLLLRAEDTREGWGSLVNRCMLALMTGAGLGVNYSDLRAEGSRLGRSGGTSSGPLALMHIINELARGARQGGARRGAIWAGLSWKHPDIFAFITSKVWSAEITAMKANDFNACAPLDCTNISVCLDDEFFLAYSMPWHALHAHARKVYLTAVHHALEHGDPGFSIDVGANAGENLRNACTEVTSADDDDICNLGSINLARVETIEEFAQLVELGTYFLLCGSVYSDVPYNEIRNVRQKNRRLGLGLMGTHEWLLQRGKQYGPDAELETWLKVYAQSTEIAVKQAAKLGISPPVKTRAIAPNGTIGIVAETSTSAEPLFCVAYKRRWRNGDVHNFSYVVDPTAKRLIDAGTHKPEDIETAYDLANDVERRLSFQAWLQQFVDHGISSTINLPSWDPASATNGHVEQFAETLMKYLPHLRGITVYPDGARGGQPLTVVSYEEAVSGQGEVFIEGADVCDLAKGGGCG